MRELVKKFYQRRAEKEFLQSRLVEIEHKILLCKDSNYLEVLKQIRNEIKERM